MFICLTQEILDKCLNPKLLVEISQAVDEVLIAFNDGVHMSTDTVSALNVDQLDELFLKGFISCLVGCISQLWVSFTRHFDSLSGISRVYTLFFNDFGQNVGNEFGCIVCDVVHPLKDFIKIQFVMLEFL